MSEFILPEGWPRPSGFAQGIIREGRVLTLAGQVGWDPRTHELVSGFGPQATRALENLAELLRTAGAKPEDLVRVTWYITNRQEYMQARKEIGVAWRKLFGKHYPPTAVIIVAGLLQTSALVEIEATAVVG